MLSISEIEELFGITRRTLQEYDDKDVDLLHPSSKGRDGKDKRGTWEYDDDALYRLHLITLFREMGYTRKKIKNILDGPSMNLTEELTKGKQKLLEKKSRIEAFIAFLDIYQLLFDYPEYCKEFLSKADFERKTINKMDIDSFLGVGKQCIVDGKQVIDVQNAPFFKLIILLSLMTFQHKFKPDSIEVQQYIDDSIKHYIGMRMFNVEVFDEQQKNFITSIVSDKELQEEIWDWVDYCLGVQSFCEDINEKNGKGSIEYMKKAIDFYREKNGY